MLQQIRLLLFHKAWHNVKSVQIALQSRILLFFFTAWYNVKSTWITSQSTICSKMFSGCLFGHRLWINRVIEVSYPFKQLAFVSKDFKRAYKLLMMRHQTPGMLMLLLSVYQHQHNSDRLGVVESITSSLLIFRLP